MSRLPIPIQRRRGDHRQPSSSERGAAGGEALSDSSVLSRVGRRGSSAAVKGPLRRIGRKTIPILSLAAVLSVAAYGQWGARSSALPGTPPNAGGGRVEGSSTVTTTSPVSSRANSRSGGELDNSRERGRALGISFETRGRSVLDTGGVREKPGGNLRKAQTGGHGDDELTVFIGIKIGEGPRGLRFSEIRRTWLEDALAVNDRVRIRFFTRRGTSSDVPSNETALPNLKGGGGRWPDAVSLQSLLVPTDCKMGGLTCMTSAMFDYYLRHHANGTSPMASYFCNFDDDQYVLVDNLLNALESYSKEPPWRGRNLYIGKSPQRHTPKNWKGVLYPMGNSRGMRKLRFFTGGAGYCLSRDLVERGARHFRSLPNQPDDVAVGMVVQDELKVDVPVVDVRFHSHLTSDPAKELPLEELSQQIAFGYNTKLSDNKALETFPNITVLFSHKEDPLRFRSLRCFLKKDDASGKYPPECDGRLSAIDN